MHPALRGPGWQRRAAATDARHARRDLSRPRHRRRAPRSAALDRPAADGRDRPRLHRHRRAGAGGDPRRADLVARQRAGGAAARPRAPLRRGRRQRDPDLAPPRRGARHRRPDRGDARRAGRGARRAPPPSTAARWCARWAASSRAARGEARPPAGRRGHPARGAGAAGAAAREAGELRRPRRRDGRARGLERPRPDRVSGAGLSTAPPAPKWPGPVALVAGDRQSDGIFPLWSIAANITVASLGRFLAGPLIDPRRERAFAEDWRSASASARRTSATRSCRSRAATSRRCCSPVRSAPTPASS